MKKYFLSCCMLAALAAASKPAAAQYPVIPPAQEDSANAVHISKTGYSNIEVYLNSVVPVESIKPAR